MQFTKKQKVAAVLGGGAVAVAGAGIAFAAWSSTGAGSGTAQSTTSVNSVIASAASAADLYPGATKSVTVTISNPNDYPVIVTGISAGTSDATSGGCVANTVTSDLKSAAAGLLQSNGTDTTIAGKGSGTFTLVTHMGPSPADNCKSQSFNLPLTATLQSNAS